ncbi:MAG TPA: hypothetical protein VN732_04575 [Solirubrobacterales bacterium]|nr:hypothetical protein [Solirubrobacterales bacterium]
MSKKMIVLALAIASAAMFALPSLALAETLHISSPGAFTVSGGTGTLSTASGTTIHCGEVGGSGSFESTTTGTVELKFGPTCTTTVLGSTKHCQSFAIGAPHNHPTETGVIWTTTLPFHLFTNSKKEAVVLFTPNAATGKFAHIHCETVVGTVNITVEGTGVAGKIKSPVCGAKSSTAVVDVNATAHGVQEAQEITKVTYGLKKGSENAAQDTEATLSFTDKVERTLTCT